MSNIKLLHVVALRCHPNAFYLNKAIQEQHASLGIDNFKVCHPCCVCNSLGGRRIVKTTQL